MAAALLITGLGGWVLRESVQAAVLRSVEQGLNERIERVLARLQRDPDGRALQERAIAGDEFHAIFSGWYWQLHDGQHVLRSRSLWDSRLQLAAARRIGHRTQLLRMTGPRGEALLGLHRRVPLDGRWVDLYLGGPARETEVELAQLDTVLAGTLAALIGVLMLAALAQVRVGLRPLRRLPPRRSKGCATCESRPERQRPPPDARGSALGKARATTGDRWLRHSPSASACVSAEAGSCRHSA